MKFKNFKEAHSYYKYPSTHRFGTISNEKGVIRSYSNGKNNDKILNNGNKIYYMIKNERIKGYFELNKKYNKKLRFFRKIDNYVLDMGLYFVNKFIDGYVILLKK